MSMFILDCPESRNLILKFRDIKEKILIKENDKIVKEILEDTFCTKIPCPNCCYEENKHRFNADLFEYTQRRIWEKRGRLSVFSNAKHIRQSNYYPCKKCILKYNPFNSRRNHVKSEQ